MLDHGTRRSRTGVAVALTGLAASLAVPVLAAPSAQAAGRLTCTARMSDPRPHQYSTTRVLVSTAPSASVRTSARYKTTTTTHTATADRSGRASVLYRTARATKGYRVLVTVTVAKGAARGTCATSFVPR